MIPNNSKQASPSIPPRMLLGDKEAIDELLSIRDELKSNIAEMEKAFESDPQLTAKIKEMRQLYVVVTALEKRRDELMNERNEAIREVKSWKKKYDRLLKEKRACE